MNKMNNKGSVLIFVLIFIAFSAATVIYVYDRSMKSFASATDDFYDNQSDIYAMTAMSAVEKLLEDDDTVYDYKDEDWENIPTTTVPYGSISVNVTPLNSKIALNRMADDDADISTRYLEACQRVLDDQSITDITCAEIKDYIDEDSDVTAGGAENKDYTYNGVTFHTKNGNLSSMRELRAIFPSSDEYEKVKNYFTTDDNVGLNINFASADTITYLLPELSDYAEQIAEHTNGDHFKDVSDLVSDIGVPQTVYNEVLPYITVKSTLFYVRTEVTLNGKSRYYHAIISKNGDIVKTTRFLAGADGQYY